MTDFASEFQKVFSNSCPPTTDWSKPRPFDGINNECYQAESALMSSLTSEAYNQFGFEVQYFIKKSSTEKDKLYGEDTLENFERRFRLKVYAENVPQLQRSYQLQGMVYTEIVTVQATIEHFREASTYDWVTREPAWKEYYPKIGDVMYFPWCDLYYEVLNVKEFAEGTAFLSTPITFTFQLRVWRNAHESVDHVKVNDDNMEHLKSYVELSETFDINHKTDATQYERENQPVAEKIPEQQQLKTSKVKAERTSDPLCINDDLVNIEKSKNVSLMDPRVPIKNKDKSFDPFDGW